MHDLNSTDARLYQACRQALDQSADRPARVDEENLLLVVLGRGDELSAAERDAVIRAIADDPETAELAAALHRLDLAAIPATPATATARPDILFTFRRTVQVAWALAACLLLTLGVWRLADPPAPLTRHGTLTPYATANQVDYWQQLDRQRLVERADRDRYRDYALVAASAACLILSIGVVGVLLRKQRDAHPPAR